VRFRVEVTGYRELAEALAHMGPNAKKRLRPKMIAWGERVLANAKQLVPVGEDDPVPGLLRESGRVVRPTISLAKQKLVLSVVFGGDPVLRNVRVGHRHSDNLYALKQHEDLTLKHNDGQAKFLERPFMAAAPEFPDMILDALDEAANAG